jgi:hypothetical protein
MHVGACPARRLCAVGRVRGENKIEWCRDRERCTRLGSIATIRTRLEDATSRAVRGYRA